MVYKYLQINNISRLQNSPEQLNLLAAQRYYYARAKFWRIVQLFFVAGGTISWAFLLLDHHPWEAWAALYGIIISLLDEWLFEPLIMNQERMGALVQEKFECKTLGIPWNDVIVEGEPNPEDIEYAKTKYQRKDPDMKSLLDWYPPLVASLPLGLARLACQRANRRWDIDLRSRYITGIQILFGSLTILSLLYGVHMNLELGRFVLVILVPLLPALLWLARELRKQQESLNVSKRLADRIQQSWKEVLTDQISEAMLVTRSRSYQDEVYRLRCVRPLMFDSVYKLFRNQQEHLMINALQELVREYESSVISQKK